MSDDLESMMFRPSETSDILMIMLSGRQAGFIEPLHFNMSFVTRKLDVNRMYLRDNFGMWYHDGLQGVTKDMTDTAEFLREHIAEEGYSRVVVVGVSSGGYAALVLGAMIGADEVHAFGPPTLFQKGMREGMEFRIERSLNKLLERTELDPIFLDLRSFFERYPVKPSGGRVLLYFDPEFDIDAERCTYLADVPGVELVECPGTGHQVMKAFIKDKAFFESVAFGKAFAPDHG